MADKSVAACVVEALQAWAEGRSTNAAFRGLDHAQREIARAIARSQAEIVTFYGKAILAGADWRTVPEKRRELVRVYVASRELLNAS